jgi:hypothetical protein
MQEPAKCANLEYFMKGIFYNLRLCRLSGFCVRKVKNTERGIFFKYVILSIQKINNFNPMYKCKYVFVKKSSKKVTKKIRFSKQRLNIFCHWEKFSFLKSVYNSLFMIPNMGSLKKKEKFPSQKCDFFKFQDANKNVSERLIL